MPESVALINLGCPKNLVDAEVMLGHLSAGGFLLTPDPADADVVVVNTCGFLEEAAQESINTLLELAANKSRGRLKAVIAAGCMSQRYGAEVADAMPEIDGFLGVGQAHRLPEIVRQALRGERPVATGGPSAGFEGYGLRLQSAPSATAYLKLSEGCDRKCSFCIIPSIRGPMVSRSRRDIVSEARLLASQGVRELVLIGQDPVRYGADAGSPQLVPLLEELCEVEELRWIRLMYLFPDRHAASVLDAVARLPRVCDYIDMPLQHVSRPVLRAMNRPGDAESYRDLVERFRQAAPRAMLRTTFIVGFPGETEADFDELLDFVKNVAPDWAAAFRYSPEEGSASTALPGQISSAVIRDRYHRLLQTQQHVTAARLARRVGERVEVLVESVDGSRGRGRSAGQAPEIDGEVMLDLQPLPGTRPGDFIRTVITGSDNYDLSARAESLLYRSPRLTPGLLRLEAAAPRRAAA